MKKSFNFDIMGQGESKTNTSQNSRAAAKGEASKHSQDLNSQKKELLYKLLLNQEKSIQAAASVQKPKGVSKTNQQ